MLEGSIVALITPFKDNKEYAIDYEKLEELIEFHINNGTSAILVAGTTGESATLSHQEHMDVIKFSVERARGRIPIIAGAGSNSTAEAISLTKFSEEAKADYVLSITPYYNKPTQEGLYTHFSYIAKSTKLPIIIYNVPSRTGVSIQPQTLARLAKEHKNIVGIKEASGDLRLVSEMIEAVLEVGRDDFMVFSGDDFNTLTIMALGGKGVISVTANIIPKDVADMCNAMLKGDLEKARKLHISMLKVHRAMFIETNPGPVKQAMYLLGMLDNNYLRPPLVPPSTANTDKIRDTLKSYNLNPIR